MDVTFYFRTEELTVEESSNLVEVNLGVAAVQPTDKLPDKGGWQGIDPFTGLYDESGNYAWGTTEITDLESTGSFS